MESLKAVLTEEGLVSFECKVVGFPTPILRWFKDGQELKPGDVYQLTGTNSLGTYCCIAQNCMGENSSVAVLTLEDIQSQLTDEERVTLSKLHQPPKFSLCLKSQEARINEEFKFTVGVVAKPDPTLSWYRDELPIEPNERYNHYRGENDYWHLDIQSVEFVDQAEWKCVAVNDFGTTVTSCFLKLQIPRHYKKPKFLESLKAVLTEEGAVNLECKVIGVPQPTLKWYKDGVELKPGDIHKIISGQDGTCCLGTYTCEARNCMGIVASSASLLGFDDNKNQIESFKQENELQRNFSLSTIHEEHTSQMYETPVGDITIDEKADVSFSFDGKEVSVSLYETPDLTEEEALKIVEMYADQISEHVTEHNIVELPPLRFVKETSQSGNLIMEAVVIDIAPEYFMHEEDLNTEAGMDDISLCEVTIHGDSIHEIISDKDLEELANKSIETFNKEIEVKKIERKRKKSRGTEADDFYTLSKTSNDNDKTIDDSSELQTFMSAQTFSEGSGSTKLDELTIPDISPPKRKRSKSKEINTDSTQTEDTEFKLQDISGEVGDGFKPHKTVTNITDDKKIRENVEAILPLARILNVIEKHLTVIEDEVDVESVNMMSAASADQSKKILTDLKRPLKQIQGKLRVYSGDIALENLFEALDGDVKDIHKNLQIIERCVELDEDGKTLVQRTSVCIVDSIGTQLLNGMTEVRNIANKFENNNLKLEINILVDEMEGGIHMTQDNIKSQALLQELQDLEAAKHLSEAVAKMQEIPEPADMNIEDISSGKLPTEAKSLKTMCRCVLELQKSIDVIEQDLSLEKGEDTVWEDIHKIIEPITKLQEAVDDISTKVNILPGQERLEDKINICLLDIVTPPLFELKKVLELVEIKGAEANPIQILDSLVPPLQEIQNGLAQLGSEIESHKEVQQEQMQSLDAQKLIQSLAQAVLNLETNVDQIEPILAQNIASGLSDLRNDMSRFVGNALDTPITNNKLEVLSNIKKPIDEINYCLRQIETKSASGSLGDLIGPLKNLSERSKQGEDILVMSGFDHGDPNVSTLNQIRKIVKNLEIDIEEHEFKLLQKEIEAEEQHEKELSQKEGLAASKSEEIEFIKQMDIMENIRNIAVNMEDTQAIETLSSFVAHKQFLGADKIISEVNSLKKAMVQEEETLHLETVTSIAENILNIKGQMAKMQEQIPSKDIERHPDMKIIKEKAETVYDLLLYVENIDDNTLNQWKSGSFAEPASPHAEDTSIAVSSIGSEGAPSFKEDIRQGEKLVVTKDERVVSSGELKEAISLKEELSKVDELPSISLKTQPEQSVSKGELVSKKEQTITSQRQTITEEELTISRGMEQSTSKTTKMEVEKSEASSKTTNFQINIENGLKQINDCLKSGKIQKNKTNANLSRIEACLHDVRLSFENLSTQVKSSKDTESVALASSDIPRALFKLKECLVHTYECGFDEPLEDIERAFEDVLQIIPALECLLAQQMSEKCLYTVNNLLTSVKNSQKADKMVYLELLEQPFKTLLRNIKEISESKSIEIEKSNIKICRLQNNLMTTFRILNEVSEQCPNELLDHVLNAQSKLVSLQFLLSLSSF